MFAVRHCDLMYPNLQMHYHTCLSVACIQSVLMTR